VDSKSVDYKEEQLQEDLPHATTQSKLEAFTWTFWPETKRPAHRKLSASLINLVSFQIVVFNRFSIRELSSGFNKVTYMLLRQSNLYFDTFIFFENKVVICHLS